MAEIRERILRQMQTMVNRGHHPTTESYLNYIFEDLMDDYYGALSRSEKQALLKDLKQHFTIDQSAPDLWTKPDDGFETRVLEAFSQQLTQSQNLSYPVDITFYRMIGRIIDQEQVHLTRLQCQDLYVKIKQQLGL